MKHILIDNRKRLPSVYALDSQIANQNVYRLNFKHAIICNDVAGERSDHAYNPLALSSITLVSSFSLNWFDED